MSSPQDDMEEGIANQVWRDKHKAIVASGNPSDGFVFVGPFDDGNEAGDWADGPTGFPNGDWWILTLKAPT